MAKNQHTYAKRLREIEKKRKADEKRERRLAKSKGDDLDPDAPAVDGDDPSAGSDQTPDALNNTDQPDSV